MLWITIFSNERFLHFFLVACEWDEWSDWDTCSLTCGGGMTARVRNIKVYPQFGGEICQGQAAEMKVCNNQTCPSEDNFKN